MVECILSVNIYYTEYTMPPDPSSNQNWQRHGLGIWEGLRFIGRTEKTEMN